MGGPAGRSPPEEKDDLIRIDRPFAVKTARGSIVLAVSVAYLSYVFQLSNERFWAAGMGDWMDPYFINALLEHWYRWLGTLGDPSSPPMYYPARRTLGYSHGLILYAPFYIPLRLFLHPFQAHNLTVFLVMEAGTICLYLLCRKGFRLGFLESLLLSVFFLTSQNVTNGATSIWAQRASVFLIPPILLMAVLSARMVNGRSKMLAAWLSGCLATLLFVQDFYTAQFALFFFVLFIAAVMRERGAAVRRHITTLWATDRTAARWALVTALAAMAWVAFLWLFGGGIIEVAGLRIRSNDWRRPALIALAALVVFVLLRGGGRSRRDLAGLATSWLVAFSSGATVGAVIFLWMYLGAYREHRTFPVEHLMSALVTPDASKWTGPLDFLESLSAYDTVRSFVLVFVVALLASLPWFQVHRRIRLYCLAFLVLSSIVLVIPVRYNDFSIWMAFFARLPGFGPIRDPRRIIYLYELAVVLAAGFLLANLPKRSICRISIGVLVFLLLMTYPNRAVFRTDRPVVLYDRWVAAPIAVDESCKSFFISGASSEYMKRSPNMRFLYNIDAVFIALDYSIPTLNGYSAWEPVGWGLHNPHHDDYPESVARWVEQHQLSGVCALDIDARTMKPWRP